MQKIASFLGVLVGIVFICGGAAFGQGCNPLLDSDGDTIDDCADVCPGFDDLVDTDADTVPDGCDLCPSGDDLVDTDSDGIPDACDGGGKRRTIAFVLFCEEKIVGLEQSCTEEECKKLCEELSGSSDASDPQDEMQQTKPEEKGSKRHPEPLDFGSFRMMTPDTVSPEVLPSDLPDTGASLDAEEVMYDGFGAVGVWLLALTMGLWLSYQGWRGRLTFLSVSLLSKVVRFQYLSNQIIENGL